MEGVSSAIVGVDPANTGPHAAGRLHPARCGNILNLRGSKELALGSGRRLDIDVDVFNVLNAATPTNANFQSGPSFGYITDVIPARIAPLGARFRF